MQITLTHSRPKIVHACGHINAATGDVLRHQLVETVSSQEHGAVLVDMSQVESLDCDGLMALVSVLSLAQKLDKKFGVVGVSPSIRIIFELTQLDRLFEIDRPTVSLAA